MESKVTICEICVFSLFSDSFDWFVHVLDKNFGLSLLLFSKKNDGGVAFILPIFFLNWWVGSWIWAEYGCNGITYWDISLSIAVAEFLLLNKWNICCQSVDDMCIISWLRLVLKKNYIIFSIWVNFANYVRTSLIEWNYGLNYWQINVYVPIAGDWLQGPYVYYLYSTYGYGKGDIGQLFIAGFGSSMLFGTIVGSLADKQWVFHSDLCLMVSCLLDINSIC